MVSPLTPYFRNNSKLVKLAECYFCPISKGFNKTKTFHSFCFWSICLHKQLSWNDSPSLKVSLEGISPQSLHRLRHAWNEWPPPCPHSTDISRPVLERHSWVRKNSPQEHVLENVFEWWFYHILIYFYVHAGCGMCVCAHKCHSSDVEVRDNLWESIRPSTMWTWKVQLWSSCWAAGTFSHWASHRPMVTLF